MLFGKAARGKCNQLVRRTVFWLGSWLIMAVGGQFYATIVVP